VILSSGTTDFLDAEQLLDRVSIPTTLPEMVFPPELRDYCWLEFEDMLGDEFWACLQQCAIEAGEAHVLVRCRSPYPIENFGFPGIAKFDVSATANEYSDFLDIALPESRQISPRNMGEAFQVAGAAGRWAFHGDRSVELLVGAHASGLHWPVVRGVRYHTFETMLDLASAPYRRIPPPGLLEAYEARYRSGSWRINAFVEGK
jgi:hypothetical protein